MFCLYCTLIISEESSNASAPKTNRSRTLLVEDPKIVSCIHYYIWMGITCYLLRVACLARVAAHRRKHKLTSIHLSRQEWVHARRLVTFFHVFSGRYIFYYHCSWLSPTGRGWWYVLHFVYVQCCSITDFVCTSVSRVNIRISLYVCVCACVQVIVCMWL